jgi:hypothetical protein
MPSENVWPRITPRPFAALVAVTAVALMALPGPSSAALRTGGGAEVTGNREVFQGLRYGNTEEVALPASNGYRVTVLARAGATTPTSTTGEVQLITERGDERSDIYPGER